MYRSNYYMLKLTFKALFVLVVKASLLLKVVLLKGNGDFISVLVFGGFGEKKREISKTFLHSRMYKAVA